MLTQRVPYPPTKGEKIRHWHILQHLRHRYDIYLGCLCDDPDDRAHLPVLRGLCAGLHVAPLDRRWARLTCLRGLLTGAPLSVTYYRNKALGGWVRSVLQDVRPSVTLVCSSNMAPYVLGPTRKDWRCLVDLADVDSEKFRAYAQAGAPPMRWVYAREARKLAQLEGRILRESDGSIFVSVAEAALFDGLQPGYAGKIRAVSNGVDHGYFDPSPGFAAPYPAKGLNFVFTGTMDYKPNIEAVCWFVQAILPIIRRTAPGARFHIVGAHPAATVVRLGDVDGVFVTGRVADVRPYLAHATAAVAPMRLARGIQNKVLEAMAMARPVVATREALTGIEATPGVEVLLAETDVAFAACCLHAAKQAGRAIGRAARQRVLRNHDWSACLRALDALLCME